MFSNYLKIALRGFAKHKLTFFINTLGLSLGLWAAILIGLWIKSELEKGKGLPEFDQVYRVMEHQPYGDQVFTIPSTPGILAETMKESLSEVEYAATYTWNEEHLFVHEENKIKLTGLYAGPDYLKIFQFPLLVGNRESALTDKSHIVLTESAAIKLFGKSDVLGEQVELISNEETELYLVEGIIADPGEKSESRFEYILPYQVMFDKPYNDWLKHWGNNGPSTILKLQEGTDPDQFSASIKNFIKDRMEGANAELFVFPQSDMYLHGSWKDGILQEGRIKTVKLFALIGFFILIIACINFMNLSTAKSQKRAKEVGVRKVSGADRQSLIYQFLSESLVITFLSGFLALLLVQATLPLFNQLTDKSLMIPFSELGFWLQFIGILLFTGLIAGSYPAFYLSATKVVSVFKNHLKGSKNVVLARKGLVLFQFILATGLIVSTVVIFQQINYALNQDLGYEKDQLIAVSLEGQLKEKYEIFKSRVESIPQVASMTRALHNMMGRSNNTGGLDWEGKDPDFNALFERFRVDYDFVETMGMELISGEDFSRERGSDSLSAVILNEKAFQIITQNNPENRMVNINGDQRQVIGVVKDFHFQSVHEAMEPAFIILEPQFAGNAFIRVKPGEMQQTLASIQQVAEELNPLFPFGYQFMDDNYARMYQDDVRLRDLAQYFSILTILISCLGLLGLSAHMAEQKTKEIGIRKVLGASTWSILTVINKEFISIVLLSILIGSGFAFWLMKDWLEGYAYRINFEWWFIPMAAAFILGIAVLTVGLQSLRAARSNPVNAIKSE
ncbi:ABC-type antimicrobial peptide transport system, permease component [Algoriphagus faecimaris]|uniref:ABC-type antimicrobial peptide transport system, permease component n=1 Tax=Algoriphagus faecimaris TaxID=686796 RepID=A0A1G6NCQ0_9BACT|nr:ABC transporter permease [Algoriphagus faecimaris]SDC65578.1 ABC-type antimicrobial peptide transport system, permease component [Algoriphagus faecimaris]